MDRVQVLVKNNEGLVSPRALAGATQRRKLPKGFHPNCLPLGAIPASLMTFSRSFQSFLQPGEQRWVKIVKACPGIPWKQTTPTLPRKVSLTLILNWHSRPAARVIAVCSPASKPGPSRQSGSGLPACSLGHKGTERCLRSRPVGGPC